MGITKLFVGQRNCKRRVARRRKLFAESLEDRRLLAVDLVSVVDPTLVPDSASGDIGSVGRRISDDGRLLVFTSDADNLVPDDSNYATDVFVRDLVSGTTTLVSINLAGTTSGNHRSFNPVISADGRFVAFVSQANDLVPNDSNNADDVFVHDLIHGTTELVSSNSLGTASGNANSTEPTISSDGRFVAFKSDASNLTGGDTNNVTDVFVRDLAGGTTMLVSINHDGTNSGNNISQDPIISSDGRSVVFISGASNLVGNNTSNAVNVFVRDLVNEATTLVSVNSAGTGGGNSGSTDPVISGDGQFVAFVSYASDLVGNDTNRWRDVFVRDLVHGTTELVSINSAGTASGNFFSVEPVISEDGRFVAFESYASDLVAISDTNRTDDVFVRDLASGTTTLVSVNSAGTASGNGTSRGNPVISADGRYVAYTSYASDLVANDTNNSQDVFVRDLVDSTTTLVSVNSAGSASGNSYSSFLRDTVISADGRRVAFRSNASDLVGGDTNNTQDVFARDLLNDTTTLVSVRDASLPSASANSTSYRQSVSADGRFVVFESYASNLVAGDTNNANDIFIRDMVDGTTTLVSVNSTGTGSGNDRSFNPVISADGRFVAFESIATNLAGIDNNNATDVFVRDLANGATTLVSVNSAGTATGNYLSLNPVISADGRTIAFWSFANDLVGGDTNRQGDVFVRDLVGGTTTLASINSAGTGSGNHLSRSPSISADGRFVAFASYASNLVSATANNAWNIFVRDLAGGTTTLVSINRAGIASGKSSYQDPAIIADGRFVAFTSYASDLVANDTNNALDVFVRDLVAGSTELVSINSSGTDSGNGSSYGVVISADGKVVAFESDASDLAGSDTNNATDVFARDLDDSSTTLVSSNRSGTASGNDESSNPVISADGKFVAFVSYASDLVGSDSNGTVDIFVRELDHSASALVSINRERSDSGNRFSGDPVISADGQFVVFSSSASNLVEADFNVGQDVFAFRRTVTPVGIDIKPGSDQNTINLGSNGTTPVAILSSEGFDATTVDALTVKLAGAGAKLRGNGSPHTSLKDVNKDGYTDLIVHVLTDALQLTVGDETATLTGLTTDGQEIEGSDTIRIVGGRFAETRGRGSADSLNDSELNAVVPFASSASWAGAAHSSDVSSIEVVQFDEEAVFSSSSFAWKRAADHKLSPRRIDRVMHDFGQDEEEDEFFIRLDGNDVLKNHFGNALD